MKKKKHKMDLTNSLECKFFPAHNGQFGQFLCMGDSLKRCLKMCEHPLTRDLFCKSLIYFHAVLPARLVSQGGQKLIA